MIFPSGENVVFTKKCAISGQEFFVTDKDLEFYEKMSPVFGKKKYTISSPTLCPDERMRRRLSWRNEQKLYRRKCDLTNREIVAMYSPDTSFPVYARKAWWSDDWSPFDWGKSFDFSRSFFDQYSELMKVVPLPAMLGTNLENSDFTLHSVDLRDCYLVISTLTGEKLLYGYQGNDSKNCVDFYHNGDSEYCYEAIDVHHSYRCFFSQDLENCRECNFCYGCNNCDHCLFCFNTNGKSYCINNKQYSKDEYENELQKIRLSQQLPALRKRWGEMQLVTFHRALHGVKNENCIGDYLNNCSNCFTCFNYTNGENLRYVSTGIGSKDSIDCNYTTGEWNYECLSPVTPRGTAFCAYSWNSIESFYCHYCQACTNCFGSISLKHAKNSILNKPYSVQEYEELCGKIIDHMRSTGEWGEFFPHELSPFGYNETVANEYFPMTEEAVKQMPRFEEWRNSKKGNVKSEKELRDTPFGKVGEEGVNLTPSGDGQGDFATQEKSFPPREARSTSFQKEDGFKGWNWYTEPLKTFEGTSIQPLTIDQYDEKIVGFESAQKNIDELLAGVIKCEVTKKPFQIIRQELAFYIENGIPIPTKHPDQRHTERMSLRNSRKLFERTCAECTKDIITTYAPERSERVVCEECYRKLVY